MPGFRAPIRRPKERLSDFIDRSTEAHARWERERDARWHSINCDCDICDARNAAADGEYQFRKENHE